MTAWDEFRDLLWERMKQRCCADPKQARRITQMSKDEFEAAFSDAVLAFTQPAPEQPDPAVLKHSG